MLSKNGRLRRPFFYLKDTKGASKNLKNFFSFWENIGINALKSIAIQRIRE
jgi:hypothetical protein